MNDAISAYLQTRIDAGDFPSAVYLVAEKGEIVYQDALGFAVVEPERIPAKLDTIYDLASLTKPLVTGLLAALKIDQGNLSLRTKIGRLSSFGSNGLIGELTVQELATHVSGLPAWLPFYLLADSSSPKDIHHVIGRQAIEKRGDMVEYSDLNFIALVGAIGAFRPDTEFDVRVAQVLELSTTFFNPLSHNAERSQIAASERGNEYERQTCIERGFLTGDDRGKVSEILRKDIIWGDVHDGNAYFMGGVGGHAGLFGTAEEVFKIALQFLPTYSKLLKPETCKLFRTNFTEGLNEDRSFAFQLASTKDSTAGNLMSPESFGHLGFTGTSLWVDPIKDRIFILLTNRTHNHSLPFININGVRRRFHDLAIEQLEEKR